MSYDLDSILDSIIHTSYIQLRRFPFPHPYLYSSRSFLSQENKRALSGSIRAVTGLQIVSSSLYTPSRLKEKFNLKIFLVAFGLTLGAFFVQYASWSWCFWFSAIMATPLVVMSFWLIPNDVGSTSSSSSGSAELGAGSSLPSSRDNSSEGIKTKARGLDLIGVSVLTGECYARPNLIRCPHL